MKNLRTILFTALLCGIAGTASANSFNINEHDPRVTGRGGATAASNEEASSIVFNPAGLARGDGTQVLFATSLYIAEGWYCDAAQSANNDCRGSGTRTDSPPAPVPNLYVAHRINNLLAIGIGFHLPFGLAVSYPRDHLQASVAQDSDLRTLFISPTVGFNLHRQVPGLSFGVGFDIVPASVQLKRDLVFGETRGTVDLGADTVGFGFRAGVQYHPPAVKGLKLGVMYRSRVTLDFKGTADFDIAEPYRSQVPEDGDASTTIRLPMTVAGGLAFSPVPNLEVEFNAVWIQWSKTFEKDAERGGDSTSLTIALPGGATSVIPQDYKDTVSYRLGLDYKLPKSRANLRAGIIYDPTPIPITTQTAQLPDVNRIALTIGASKQLSDRLGLHAGALWIPPRERDSSADPAVPIFHGTYGVQALVLSVGVAGRFGAQAAAPTGIPKVATNVRSEP